MIGFVLSLSEIWTFTFPSDRATRFEAQLAAPALTKAVDA
jgi:hypothetical protein